MAPRANTVVPNEITSIFSFVTTINNRCGRTTTDNTDAVVPWNQDKLLPSQGVKRGFEGG